MLSPFSRSLWVYGRRIGYEIRPENLAVLRRPTDLDCIACVAGRLPRTRLDVEHERGTDPDSQLVGRPKERFFLDDAGDRDHASRSTRHRRNIDLIGPDAEDNRIADCQAIGAGDLVHATFGLHVDALRM